MSTRTSDSPVRDYAALTDVLAAITFAPSFLDLRVVAFEVTTRAGRDLDDGDWLVRCAFTAPDTDTGDTVPMHGRWWLIERGATVGAVVKTAWSAVRAVVEHELHEAFLYRGARLFDPHADVDLLTAASRVRRST